MDNTNYSFIAGEDNTTTGGSNNMNLGKSNILYNVTLCATIDMDI